MNKPQLTKRELQNLEVGDKIVEKIFNQTNNWLVIEAETELSYQLKEVNTGKFMKLTVRENFNKEGDRKYKSANGNVIVKYYPNHD